jgi:hypothetical protein
MLIRALDNAYNVLREEGGAGGAHTEDIIFGQQARRMELRRCSHAFMHAITITHL